MNNVFKSFIKSVNDFEKQKDVDTIIQNLQNVSTLDDLSLFEPSSFETAEFYTTLCDLLTSHGTNSDIVWAAISVLQVAVQNTNASVALVHTFHFIAPLTTILSDQQTDDKKLVVLKIMQELTYGVVICWQEAHLPDLMMMLLDIITSGESDLVPIALGVLINLCHKSKPAIYTLRNCVDMKVLLRTVLKLLRDNVETSVQVCKLLIILNQLSGNVSDHDILSFIRLSYMRISEAFRCGNTGLMRHIVDFFRDLKDSEQGRKVMLTYQSYEEETGALISELSKKTVPNSWKCVHHLLEFLRHLVDLEQLAIVPLFPRLALCVLPWLEVEGVACTGLQVLTVMLRQSRTTDTDVYTALTSCLESHLQMLVDMVHKGCRLPPSGSEDQLTLTSLFHLLHELVAHPTLGQALATTIDKESMKKLLLPLTSINYDESQLFQHSTTGLYVEILNFMSALSMDDTEWLFLFSDLLQKKQILNALAFALYFGSYEVKKQILYLAGTSSFSRESLNILSKCLSELNQLYLFTPNTKTHSPEKCVSHQQSLLLDSSSYFTKSQRDQLDNLIDKLDDLCKNNKIGESSLLEIIELYNYKVGVMRRAEQNLQSSLQSADSHRAHLSQQVAQLNAETSRLHQLLYTAHQNLEGVHADVSQLRTKLRASEALATDSHTKCKMLKLDIQTKNEIIEEQSSEILKKNQCLEELRNKYKRLEAESTSSAANVKELNIVVERLEHNNATLTEKNESLSRHLQIEEEKALDLEAKLSDQTRVVQRLEKEKSDLQVVNSRLEEKIRLRDKSVLEKEVSIEKKTKEIQTLEQEISYLQGHNKGLEKSNKEKERELAAQQSQLAELERMRKIIFDITGGKKSNF